MNGVTLQESVNPSKTTVDQTKRMIHQKTGISYERQHLLHRGKTMTDSRTLSSYSVANGKLDFLPVMPLLLKSITPMFLSIN